MSDQETVQQGPPTKYLYNGKIYQQADIEDAAKQSNLDVNSYVSKVGMKPIADSFQYNDKNVSAEDVLDAANQSKTDFNSYIAKTGIKPILEKKNPVSSGFTNGYDGTTQPATTAQPAATSQPATPAAQPSKTVIVNKPLDQATGNLADYQKPELATTAQKNELPTGEANQTILNKDFAPVNQENPIDLVNKANELRNKEVPNSTTAMAGGFSMGTTTSQMVSDADAVKQSEDIKSQLKKQGYNFDQMDKMFGDIPESWYQMPGFSKDDLIKGLQENPKGTERLVAATKWQNNLLNNINAADIPDDTRSTLKNTIINSARDVNFDDKRLDNSSVIDMANKYVPDPDEKKKIISNLQEDRSFTYGQAAAEPTVLQNDPLKKFLNSDQIAAYHYIQDMMPEKEQSYTNALLSPDEIKDNPDAQLGREEQLKKLEEIGIQLKANYATEKLAPIKNEYATYLQKEANGEQLTPQELQRAQQLETQGAPYQDLLTAADHEMHALPVKYPNAGYLDAETFAQELLGQKHNIFSHLALETGNATGNTINGVVNFVKEPFLSDQSKQINQLEILGDKKMKDESTYLTQNNQAIQSFTPTVSKDLQSQIDNIKTADSLSDSDKRKQVTALLMQNPNDWQRTPIEGGKSNIGLASVLYGVGDLAANLAPFVVAEGLTGGGASAGMARKFTSLFTTAAATTFQDTYDQAVEQGVNNPYQYAARVTAVNALAMAGADAPGAIRKLAGEQKTVFGDLVKTMDDKSILEALRKDPETFSTLRKAYHVAGVVGKTVGESAKTAAKVTAFTTGGQVANDAISGNLKPLPDYAKEALISAMNFTIFGTIAGAPKMANDIKEPNEMSKAALYISGQQPEPMIKAVDDKLKAGAISPDDAKQVKSNIENAAEVYKKVPFVDGKGNPLNEKDRRNLMFLKMQEADLENHISKDLPESLQNAMQDRLVKTQAKIDKVYNGTFIEDVASSEKPFTYKPHPNLNKSEKTVESNFGKDLSDNFKAKKEEYQKKFGNVINPDNARTLSEDYNNDPAKNSKAVSAPASAFATRLYNDALKEKPEYNSVVFMAGGPGTGKSSVTGVAKSDITFDTNLHNFDDAKTKINNALKTGRKANIVFVYRDPEESFTNGVLPRMKDTGRTVPVDYHANVHDKSFDTIKQLAYHYKDNPDVSIKFVDNSLGNGNAKEVPFADIKAKPAIDKTDLKNKLYAAVENEYKARNINKDQRDALRGNETGTVSGNDSGSAGQSQREQNGAGNQPQGEQGKDNVGVIKRATSIEHIRDPHDVVLQYFAGGGKIHPSAINDLFGGKNEAIRIDASTEGQRKAAISYIKKDAPTISELAHNFWAEKSQHEENYPHTDDDFKQAIENVLGTIKSPADAARQLVDKYEIKDQYTPEEAAQIDDGMKKAIKQFIDHLPDEEQQQLMKVLKKYQNQYGLIDWDKLAEDSNGFDADMLSLPDKTSKHLDEIISKNTEPAANQPGQKEPGNISNENSGQQKDQAGQSGEEPIDLSTDEKKIANNEIPESAAIKIIKKGGFTADNISDFQHLFQGSPFTPEDFKNVKTYLDENGPFTAKPAEPKQQGTGDANPKKTGDQSPKTQDASPAKKQFYEDIAGAKPNKATARIAVDPIIGGDPKKLKDILRTFTTTVKQKIFYNKVQRGAGGFYRPSDKSIVLRYSGDLDTTAHEAGHMIDDQFGILPKIKENTAALKELPYFMNSPAASKPPKGHPDPRSYMRNEGFAEWLRAYVVNPKQAIYEAPEIYKIYSDNVDSKMQLAVQQLSDDVRTWAGSTGRDMMLANIDFKPDEAEGLLKRIFGKKETDGNFTINWTDKLSANFVKPMHAFEKAFEFAKGIKGIDKVLPEHDPEILSRLLLGFDGKFGSILKDGMIDSKNNVLKAKDGNIKNLNWLIEPLDNTDMKSIQRDMEDTISYMTAERTVELYKRFGKDTITGVGGGIYKDLQVANKALDEFENGDPARLNRIKESAARYREFSDDVLKYMVDKGRLSKEQYDLIKKNNVQYVAMNRIMEQDPGTELTVFRAQSGKLGSSAEVVHKIKGSTRRISNPYTSLLESLYRSVRESDRNETLKAFRDMLVESRGMNDGDVKNFADIGVKGKEGDKNAIKIFINGKPEHWIFQQDIYKSLKGLDNEAWNLPPFIRFFPALLRNTVTKFPVFAVRNTLRDTQDRLIKSNNSSIKDLFGDKEHWKQVARAGGLNAGFYVKDRSHYYGLLETAMDDMAKNKKFILADPIRLKEGWEHYENLLQKSETVNRAAEYRGALRKAKARGMDDYNAMLYAAFHARDLVDFAVAGHWMRIVNQIVPFSNAAVQGIRSGVVRFKENPAGFAARTMIYSVMPGAALWFWNHRNKEDADEYEAMPGYQRDLFWNVKIGANKWLAMPKPFELSLFGAGVDRGLSKALYGNEKAFDGYAGSVYQTLMPVDDANFGAPLTPVVEGISNYDFFRNKYVIPPYEDNLNLALRHTETASRLGQLIQKVSGIDGRKIDHFIRGQFSYTGNFAMKLSDIGRKDDKQAFNISDIGLFKQSPAYNSQPVQELLQFAQEWNLKQSRDYREFSQEVSNYFDSKTDAESEQNARPLIDHARLLLMKWKAEGIDKQKIDKFKEKNKN